MVRTATLNWEIPIGVLGLGVIWGYFDTMVTRQHFFLCLSNFNKVLKDTSLFKSTKSVPMAGFYDHFLENPGWRSAACITMGYRRLTDHQIELQGE
jgi:hypothetical protein